jgi:hypothetical protein
MLCNIVPDGKFFFFNLGNCNDPPVLQGDNFWCEVAKTTVIITSVTKFLD